MRKLQPWATTTLDELSWNIPPRTAGTLARRRMTSGRRLLVRGLCGVFGPPPRAIWRATEPAVAHDLPQNGRGRRDALQPNLGHRDCERVIWIG
jgi:hypothetical protein